MRSCILVLIVGITLIPTRAVSNPATSTKDWTLVGDSSEKLRSGEEEKYLLRNRTIKKYLAYGTRGTFGGINLVWTTKNVPNISFVSEDGGVIKYGESVALRVQGISTPYLKYEKRTLGINLGWSSDPVYEWKIGGGEEGEPVQLGKPIALLNEVEEDCLIYAERGGKAINLRWYADRDKGGYGKALWNKLKEEGMEYLAD